MANAAEGSSSQSRGFLRALGPAIIVACVVLGPGSILTSSTVGCQFGYQMSWLLIAAGLLMVGAVATAARVGVSIQKTPLNQLSSWLGRPIAALAGVSVFLITACFQFSNNVGVLASIEPLFGPTMAMKTGILIVLNGAIIACLFGFKKLYKPLERLMMFLVGLMLIGFAANLVLAKPSVLSFFSGLVPSIPESLSSNFFPQIETTAEGKSQLVDPWLALQGLVGTTFSIAGAFYQAYLVQEKGWSKSELRQGLIDSVAGTTVLIGISLMIMTTSAAVLSGNTNHSELKSAADVAQQLEPLFGSTAVALFCVGIFAGALSSFLVNSVIGGTMLADGLGFEAHIDSWWTKIFTVGVLLVGMLVALSADAKALVQLVIFAQAVTVLGTPVLAFSLLYLAWRLAKEKVVAVPVWMLALTSLGGITVLAFALRTAWRLYLNAQL